MFELTAENAADYLRSRGWIAPGPVQVEVLSGGVSNLVLRVVTPERPFVLKQSRPQLRTRDAWFSDLDRVYREQEVMEILLPLLPAPTVPEVLFSDRADYVFAMSHAPADSRVWKEDLLAGRLDRTVSEHAGAVLGQMHDATAREPSLAERLGDRTVFWQLRVDPFYLRVQQRRPEVAALIEPLVQQLLTVKEAVCHGDYTPKNLLVHEQGFTLVDYETAHFGDPTMDLGLFLAHLLLKAARRPAEREAFFDLTRVFWSGYHRTAGFRPAKELESRGIQHLAVCLLARTDGTSPVDYLPEENKREAVRGLARRILKEMPGEWEEVLAMTEIT